MELLKEWVKNIFLLIIGLSFVEMILPSGNMRKYLKFILSIMILSAVIYPLYELKDIEISAFAGPGDYTESDENQIKRLDSIQGVQISEIYKTKVKEKVTEIIHNKYPDIQINRIDIYMNDDVEQKNFGSISTLVINLSNLVAEPEDIRAAIAETLNISKDMISIKD